MSGYNNYSYRENLGKLLNNQSCCPNEPPFPVIRTSLEAYTNGFDELEEFPLNVPGWFPAIKDQEARALAYDQAIRLNLCCM